MRYRKVVLVFPPYPIPRVFPKRVQIPLGIAYLAAILREKGFEVNVIDSIVEGWEHSQIIGKKYVQYGLPLRDVALRIKHLHPDIVGLSCMFGIQLRNTVHIARMLKNQNPEVPIIIGGAHASAMPKEILEGTKAIDYVIIGEGEETLVSLLTLLNGGEDRDIKNIDGIAYRNKQGHVVVQRKTTYIRDLDALPYPARDMFPMEKYFKINRPHGTVSKYERSTSIVTSRGCPAKCIFCAIHSVWGRNFRTRSPENVVDEIAYLEGTYGIKEFQIEDDNMTFDAERVEKICDLLLERNLNVHFTTPNGVAIWALNKCLLQKMKQVGFYRLTLAIESGSEHTLKKIIRKPLDLQKVKNIVSEASKLGFIIDTFYVIGFPGETLQEMKKTFRLARRLNVNSIKYFIATPYAGTDLYEKAEKEGMLVDRFRLDNFNVNPMNASMNTEYFTAAQLEKIWFRETLKIQLLLFLKRPVSYTKDIFIVYFRKDIFRIFQVLLRVFSKFNIRNVVRNWSIPSRTIIKRKKEKAR